MFSLPLSSFQRLMLRWGEYQPFHIVDMMEVRAPVDAERLRRCAEDELNSTGLCWPVVDARERVYYLDDPAQINVCNYELVPNEGLIPGLERIGSQELNLPLRPNGDPILRLWLLRHPSRPFIGMTFQHFTADGYAAADLFRRILARYFEIPLDPNQFLDQTEPFHAGRGFAPWRTFAQLRKYLPDVLQELKRGTHVFTPRREPPDRTMLQGRILELPSSVLAHLTRIAREHDSSIHDVLATAVMWSLAQIIPERTRKRRGRISVSNMVDLRKDLGPEASRKWGAFLGFLLLHLPEPVSQNWRDSIRQVAEKSKAVKKDHLYFASLFGLRLVSAIWQALPRANRWFGSANLMRASVALSNSRLPKEWYDTRWDAHIGQNWRFGPLGSIIPLFVAATTKKDSFQLTLTCERQGVVGERLESFIEKLLGCLTG